MNMEFNLTRISFPIRCMSHESSLKIIANNFSTLPFYLGKAAQLASEPIERLKMVIAKDLSTVVYNISFEKPLNPILGETFQARGRDGAHIFME